MAVKSKPKTTSRAKRVQRKRPRRGLIWVFVGLSVLAGIMIIYRLLAATPQGVYTQWIWPNEPKGFTSMSHRLKIEANNPATKFFWAHQFKIIGGDGGYIGLQSSGNRVNGTVGKTAVFSIFSSGLAGTSGNCIVQQAGFDGYNTSGTSCRIPYEWEIGKIYQMKVAQTRSDATGKWWTAYVIDSSTGIKTFIADIKVPTTWQGINISLNWTEYFGPKLTTCDDLPYSRVRFYTPLVNDGSVAPTGKLNTLSSTSDCKSSSITNTPEGVIQTMGKESPVTSPVRLLPAYPDPGFISLNPKFITCGQPITKTTGTTACQVSTQAPVLTMRNIPTTPTGKTKFCFKGVRSASGTAKLEFIAGNETTGKTAKITRTITDGEAFDNACVATTDLYNTGSATNFAQVRATQGSVVIYGGQFK